MKRIVILCSLFFAACGGSPDSLFQVPSMGGNAVESGAAGQSGMSGFAGTAGSANTGGTVGTGGESGKGGFAGAPEDSGVGGTGGKAMDDSGIGGTSGQVGDSGIEAEASTDATECIPGETKCLKGICLPDGTWDMKGCSLGCDGNPDHPCYICSYKTKRCDGKNIQICAGLTWETMFDCPPSSDCICTSNDCSCQ